ncbi:MAG: hypothetical protein H5U22_06610 [Rhizobium sp.]|nr:hypothetical protein [Rhizobium sp.]
MDREVENLIHEAIDNLKAGRAEDALLVLERTMFPKFGSRSGCGSNYYSAMKLKAAA